MNKLWHTIRAMEYFTAINTHGLCKPNKITWMNLIILNNKEVIEKDYSIISFMNTSKMGKTYSILFGDAHINGKIMKKSKEIITMGVRMVTL